MFQIVRSLWALFGTPRRYTLMLALWLFVSRKDEPTEPKVMLGYPRIEPQITSTQPVDPAGVEPAFATFAGCLVPITPWALDAMLRSNTKGTR
jgi:hypothetical protein